MKNLYAVILSGGSGERFWPLSTQARPKQFLDIFGGRSLLRQSVDRLSGLVPPENVLVITGRSLAKATYAELPEVPRRNVILEPCRRDTAAAIATACTEVMKRGGGKAVAITLPADHVIGNVKAFRRTLSAAADAAARSGCIVTVGVKPTRPATGFGYIRTGKRCGKALEVEKFVEKPPLATAKRYLKSGRYLWNAGMFVWRADALAGEFARHAPEFSGMTVSRYGSARRISFDYAVMEKTCNALAVPADFGWDDVGTWDAAMRHLPADGRGNAVLGDATLLDSTGSVVVSGGLPVAVLGVENTVVVATRDAVLVTSRDRAQDLKKLLEEIRRKNPSGSRYRL